MELALRGFGCGDHFSEPAPILELKARLVSDDPHRAAELRSIQLNFVEPLANQLLGEIEPGVVGALGRSRSFRFSSNQGSLLRARGLTRCR